jgi:response regulator of citrate/malate metabolism
MAKGGTSGGLHRSCLKKIPLAASQPTMDRLLRAGAIDYLTKPLNIKMSLEVLDRALEGAGQVR